MALVALIMGLTAGTKLVQRRQLESTNASLCCNAGTCADGTQYGDDPTTPHSSCEARTIQFCGQAGDTTKHGGPGSGGSQCSAPAPTSGTSDQCDPANSLHCRSDGKAWWCNGSRQWEAGEGKSCSNKCSPLGSDASCSDSANYKDVGASCGANGRCVANGSTNGFTTCRCDVATATATPTTAPGSTLPSCTSPNTLLCVNGLSSWCNANSRLEIGQKACGTNVCHPTSSGPGCADSANYRNVGNSCNTVGGKCTSAGNLNGFGVCNCVNPTATPTTAVRATPTRTQQQKCAAASGVFCSKATQVCAGTANLDASTTTDYCCTGPASCTARPPEQICTPGASIACQPDGNLKKCNAAGTAYETQNCAGLGCNDAAKQCKVCTANTQKRCSGDGTSAETCNGSGLGWNSQSCSLGCNAGSKSCNTICRPGTYVCWGDGNSRICNTAGTEFVANPPSCGSKGCNPGTGQCNLCESNKTRCSTDLTSVITCNASGTGESARTCADGCVPRVTNNTFVCAEDLYVATRQCLTDTSFQHNICVLFDPLTQTCKRTEMCTPAGSVCAVRDGDDQCVAPSSGNSGSGTNSFAGQTDTTTPTPSIALNRFGGVAQPDTSVITTPTPTIATRTTFSDVINSILRISPQVSVAPTPASVIENPELAPVSPDLAIPTPVVSAPSVRNTFTQVVGSFFRAMVSLFRPR